MKITVSGLLNVVLITLLVAALFLTVAKSPTEPYDPWADIDNNGFIDVKDILYVALRYGASGTPIAKASVAFDSGWTDITNKCGQSFSVVHDLNSTDIMVDIQGKTTIDGGVHQRYLGLTNHLLGWSKKTYGGMYTDIAWSVVQTDDGGYAITGGTSSFGAGGGDVYLVKTDAAGNLQWNKTYGGTNGETGYSVIQTRDGGYAIAGDTNSFGAGGGDVYLVKTDVSGKMQWNKTYGGINLDRGISVVQTVDGYAIAGDTYSFGAGGYDVYLVKTDAAGNLQWNKTYGGTNGDYGFSVVKTGDGGCAIAGYTYSFGAGGYPNVYLVKTDAAGNLQWNKTYGGTNSDYGYSIVQTVDGGYAITGDTTSFGVSMDVYLVKIDASGNMQWNKNYGGTNGDYGRSVVETVDGGYALAGYTYSFGAGGYPNVYLVKTDAAGNLQWNKTYGGTGIEYGYSIVQTGDGSYAIAGSTDSFGAGNEDVYLVKTDIELGLAQTNSTADTITLYRGITDPYWNYVRVRIWQTK